MGNCLSRVSACCQGYKKAPDCGERGSISSVDRVHSPGDDVTPDTNTTISPNRATVGRNTRDLQETSASGSRDFAHVGTIAELSCSNAASQTINQVSDTADAATCTEILSDLADVGTNTELGCGNGSSQTDKPPSVDAVTCIQGLVSSYDIATSMGDLACTFGISEAATSTQDIPRMTPDVGELVTDDVKSLRSCGVASSDSATGNPQFFSDLISDDLARDSPISDDENASENTGARNIVALEGDRDLPSDYDSNRDHHETDPKRSLPADGARGGADQHVRHVSIKNVGTLLIYISPSDVSRSGHGDQEGSNPELIRADWDELVRTGIQEAEERVKKAEKNLEKEKKKCIRRMQSISDKYIEEWTGDVLEREAERQQILERLAETEARENEMKAQLTDELEKQKKILARLIACQEARSQGQNSVRFVMRPRHVDGRLLSDFASCMRTDQSGRAERVIQRLFEEFGVRLRAVGEDLVCLMEVSASEWERVRETQADIEAVLGGLVPEDTQVRWLEMRQCELGAEGACVVLDLPAQGSPGEVRWDPARVTQMRRIFMERPGIVGDIRLTGPGVGALVVTAAGRLVIVDWRNKMVKVTTMDNPRRVNGVSLQAKPFAMTLVNGDVVAVSAPLEKKIFRVDVSGVPRICEIVPTSRHYYGIAYVSSDGTYIVSTIRSDGEGVAGLYQITAAGLEIRTIVDSATLHDLYTPFHLCVRDTVAYVSDRLAATVFMVDVQSGHLAGRLHEENELHGPRQVAVDQEGNVYIASTESQCVLVVSRDGLTWRRLLEGGRDGEGDPPRHQPIGLALTSFGLVVSWHQWDGYSVIAGFIAETRD